MFSRIEDIINVINYCAFCVILVVGAIAGEAQRNALILAFFALLTNYTVRAYFLRGAGRRSAWRAFSTLLDMIIMSGICLLDSSGAGLCLFIFLVGGIILNSGKKSGALLVAVDYAFFCLSLFYILRGHTEIFVTVVLISIPAFGLVSTVFLLIRYQLEQNARLNVALKKLTVSKLETESLYTELKAAYEKAEDSAVQGERNRIAREIHDTVGHTLTTVLVELEAADKLMPIDTARAGEKLVLAQGQVRKGLHDIRRSVRMLEDKHEILGFFESVDALLNDCKQNWGVAIRSEIDCSLNISDEAGKVLFACLQEGLTNGKRHGKSTAFVIKLIMLSNHIVLSIEDNGAGASVVCPGFGLRAMRDRVETAGGKLRIETGEGEGFSLYVTLPLCVGIKI